MYCSAPWKSLDSAKREKGFEIMRNTVSLAAITLLTLVSLPATVNARQDGPGGGAGKSAVKSEVKQTPVTLDVRDARLRDVLEMLFKQAKVDFLIEPGVDGYVTMKVADLPFEAALKLTLRSGSIPLVYTLENGVYIVRPRPVEARTTLAPPPAYTETNLASNSPRFEVIQLLHADPADLAGLLNIIILPTGARFGNPSPGGAGGLIVGGGGFPGLGMGGLGAGNGPQNNPRNNNGTGQGRTGAPGGGGFIIAP
jgi:hypothetical protein